MRVAEAEVDDLETQAFGRRLQEEILRLKVPVRHVVVVQVLDAVQLRIDVLGYGIYDGGGRGGRWRRTFRFFVNRLVSRLNLSRGRKRKQDRR